jgi:hypothetical protein
MTGRARWRRRPTQDAPQTPPSRPQRPPSPASPGTRQRRPRRRAARAAAGRACWLHTGPRPGSWRQWPSRCSSLQSQQQSPAWPYMRCAATAPPRPRPRPPRPQSREQCPGPRGRRARRRCWRHRARPLGRHACLGARRGSSWRPDCHSAQLRPTAASPAAPPAASSSSGYSKRVRGAHSRVIGWGVYTQCACIQQSVHMGYVRRQACRSRTCAVRATLGMVRAKHAEPRAVRSGAAGCTKGASARAHCQRQPATHPKLLYPALPRNREQARRPSPGARWCAARRST